MSDGEERLELVDAHGHPGALGAGVQARERVRLGQLVGGERAGVGAVGLDRHSRTPPWGRGPPARAAPDGRRCRAGACRPAPGGARPHQLGHGPAQVVEAGHPVRALRPGRRAPGARRRGRAPPGPTAAGTARAPGRRPGRPGRRCPRPGRRGRRPTSGRAARPRPASHCPHRRDRGGERSERPRELPRGRG